MNTAILAIGYWIATAAFAALVAALVAGRRSGQSSRAVLAAAIGLLAWSTAGAVTASVVLPPVLARAAFGALELVRNAGIAFVLLRLLQPQRLGQPFRLALVGGLWLLWLASGVTVVAEAGSASALLRDYAMFARLLVCVVGLVLLEQTLRNTRSDYDWNIKYLAFGFGVPLVFDFVMLADALLFHGVDTALAQARGFVTALAAPLIHVAVRRNRRQPLRVSISRQFVFGTSMLVAAGGYLLLVATAGYYIRAFGGDWGEVLQIVLAAAAALAAVVVVASRRVRRELQLLIARNLFAYKYDYRAEWLRITQTLSRADADEALDVRALRAIGSLVGANGGALWLGRDAAGRFEFHVAHRVQWQGLASFEPSEGLLHWLGDREWIIDLADCRRAPERHADLALPAWLLQDGARLLVPLKLHDDLIGCLLLDEPAASGELIWEDFDVLRAAARQAASYLAQAEAERSLSEAQQFQAFSQMSAFVVHDLKTLVAQLSLLAKNARVHKSNPAFVDDMVTTLDHVVARMTRLVAQLRGGDLAASTRVLLAAVIEQVLRERAGTAPPPRLRCAVPHVEVLADAQRLAAVIGHVVQNAQDATPPDGDVCLEVTVDGANAVIAIADTGHGMDAHFVRSRLFRPFESTKGVAGMGIGAFQARQYLRSLGGDVAVTSEPGRGTCFELRLPLAVPLGEP
jgi:putative PEP-CTERM system histidine kinase